MKFLTLALPALLSPCVSGTSTQRGVAISSGDTELPLDGSKNSGTLNQNQYDYYTVKSSQSGVVSFTTTVTANPVGVWTWVGRGYQPVDGISDWNQGAIIGYPAKFKVENLEPNETYTVGVQGIGSPSASYTISATLQPLPYTPPTEIKIDDSMPITSQVNDAFQYTFFTADVPADGNYTVSLFPQSTAGEEKAPQEAHNERPDEKHAALHSDSTNDVSLLVSGLDLPTLGRNQWHNGTDHKGDWITVDCPFIRKDSKLSVSVHSRHSALAFYVKIDTKK